MNYKHLDEKKKAQIDVLFNLHYSMREIGRQLDISHSSVSRYLRKKPKSKKTLKGTEPYWRDGSTDPVKSTVRRAPLQHIAFEHVGYYGRWPKVAKAF